MAPQGKMMLRHWPVFFLSCTLLNAGSFPLSPEGMKLAAEAAGFRVLAINAVIPAALHSRFPFATFEYDDPLLETLRREYRLSEVIAGAPDEWTAQLKLKDWVYRQIPGGDPQSSPPNALEILKLATRGEKFYCTQYAITYAECAQALGWQARKIAVDRKHGPEGLTSTHHGVVEVWSNQFRKWAVIDAQSNVHFEKNGIPLSAWEIRAEWLNNKGAEVDHFVGATPDAVKKNPAMVWHVPDQDEIATYFWLAIEDHAGRSAASRHIFPQDQANAGELWYQNNSETRGSILHVGYTKNRFIPTTNIADAYWTVGIVEAHLAAAAGTIELTLESYCPNRTAYEVAWDETRWEKVKDEKSLVWKLHDGWNTLRLRTASRGGVHGPESAIAAFLESEKR
jgi:hypothetical protein